MGYRILIVADGQVSHAACLKEHLPPRAGFLSEIVPWNTVAEAKLRSANAHLAVLVLMGEKAATLALLDWLRGQVLRSATLAVLPHEPGEDLLRAASGAADDFVVWPALEGEFRQRVERLLGRNPFDAEPVHERLAREIGLAQLIGREPVFLEAIQRIPFMGACDAPVLIAGETGTGKELCAHAIHHLSRRAHFPFIPVECGAVPDLLAENELFGHSRGAYTDAHRDQKGLAALAEGGTLFLDEIDALSLTAQAKLLRFLQDGVYRPLGSERFAQSNVRIIAATNRDLQLLIRCKEFRSDLYFRLNVLQLQLPPLRARRGDIALLAQHFLDSFPLTVGVRPKTLSPGALRALEQNDWPGNIRELRNVVQRAVVFSSGPQILPSDVVVHLSPGAPIPAQINFRQARRQTLERFERLYVEETLRKHGGNITRAAVEAGKDRRAFGRLVKKYGVNARAL